MRNFFFVLILALWSPAFAASSDLEPQISKLEFQGIHFGDFPSVEMMCIKGLCPVGFLGVGINTNSRIPPTYIKEMAISNYNRVKISTPEYSYTDDKMFQIQFEIDCAWNAQQECVDAVIGGLDAEFGLTLIETSGVDNPDFPNRVDAYETKSSSAVIVFRSKENKRGAYPVVKIFDRTLMDIARTAMNPDYPAYAAKVRARQAEKAANKQ